MATWVEMIWREMFFAVAVTVAGAVDGKQLATKLRCRWDADWQQVESFWVV